MTLKADIDIAESYIAEARYDMAETMRKVEAYLDSADRLLRRVKAELEEDERRGTHV